MITIFINDSAQPKPCTVHCEQEYCFGLLSILDRVKTLRGVKIWVDNIPVDNTNLEYLGFGGYAHLIKEVPYNWED